jgi:hypothetical protein
MAMIASGGWREPITGCMKRSSTMALTAGKPNAGAKSCTKHASGAGTATIVGGTNMSIGGIPTATGMITTTIAINRGFERFHTRAQSTVPGCALFFSGFPLAEKFCNGKSNRKNKRGAPSMKAAPRSYF